MGWVVPRMMYFLRMFPITLSMRILTYVIRLVFSTSIRLNRSFPLVNTGILVLEQYNPTDSWSFRAMVNFCAVFGCSNRRNREQDEGYYRIRAILSSSKFKKQALSVESDLGPFVNEHIAVLGAERRNCVVCRKRERKQFSLRYRLIVKLVSVNSTFMQLISKITNC